MMAEGNCICTTSTVLVNVTDADGEFVEESWCPDYNECCDQLLTQLGFWLEGVVQTGFAFSGILTNFVSSLILASKEMRNSFNLLLIALAFFDSCYLIGSILESFRKSFNLLSHVHKLMFPYLLYPGQMIMMSASVFMTVAISMERYVAVHYPLDYNFAMNDEGASFRRLLKYVIPVITFSVAFNIPKFFEAELTYDSDEPILGVTKMRIDPNYAIYYNNWTRLVILGIIPTLLLTYFNAKIYQDIMVRRARRHPQREIMMKDTSKRSAVPQPATTTTTTNGTTPKAVANVAKPSPTTTAAVNLNQQTKTVEKTVETVGEEHHPLMCATNDEQEPSSSVKPCAVAMLPRPANAGPEAAAGQSPVEGTIATRERSKAKSTKKISGQSSGRILTNVNRRRREDNLAMIFMGIVLVFLLCHFPRVILSFHETLVIKRALACSDAQHHQFPLWALIFSYVSHLLLVLNSSANSIIYCMLSSKFKVTAVKYFANIRDRFQSVVNSCT